MSVSVEFSSTVRVAQTLEGEYVNPADATVTVDQLSETATYTASSSVPATKSAAFQQAMTAGAASIDLTALPGLTAEEEIDGTGLKVQVAKFRSLSTNESDITVAEGASNGYALLGASFAFVLKPGQSVLVKLNEAAPDVAAGDRVIDVSGTGTEVLEVHLVLG